MLQGFINRNAIFYFKSLSVAEILTTYFAWVISDIHCFDRLSCNVCSRYHVHHSVEVNCSH